jgi:hypothetical protein
MDSTTTMFPHPDDCFDLRHDTCARGIKPGWHLSGCIELEWIRFQRAPISALRLSRLAGQEGGGILPSAQSRQRSRRQVTGESPGYRVQ